jgi:DNA-directed RNA polymerase subunit RPC12/RpoP
MDAWRSVPSLKRSLAKTEMRDRDGSGVKVVFVGKHRDVGRRLLLNFLTFGIARRVWLYRVNKELDGHEALGLRHKLNAYLLGAPLAGLLLLFILTASGVGISTAALLAAATFVPGSVITALTALRVKRMLAGSEIPHGPWFLAYMATWVPILGTAFFVGWEQSRLNRFWEHEREHPEHGIEIDIDLTQDPSFLVEIREAMKESQEAGSRLDVRRRQREERLRNLQHWWHDVQAERQAVRAAGGSTPVLPWRRPVPPKRRRLSITCGRCSHRFDAEQDPLAETVLHCPNCDLHEVLPALGSDPLAAPGRAGYAAIKVTCPKCQRKFSTNRRLDGPTPITCPACGKTETLPAPKVPA